MLRIGSGEKLKIRACQKCGGDHGNLLRSDSTPALQISKAPAPDGLNCGNMYHVRRRAGNWWTAAGVIAALLVALAAVARMEIQSRLSSPKLDGELSRALGFDVRTGAASVTWSGTVALNGVEVAAGPRTFLSAEQIRIALSPLSLLRGSAAIRSVTLERPRLALDAGIVGLVSSRLRKTSNRPANFPVYVRDGTVSYRSSNGKTVSVANLAGNVLLSGSETPVDFSFTGEGGGLCRVSGVSGKDRVDLRGNLQNFSLSDLVNPFGKFSPGSIKGTVSGGFALSGSPENLRVSAQADVRSALFDGAVTLAGGVSRRGGAVFFHGSLAAVNGEMEGIGAFRDLSFGIDLSRSGIALRGGRLSFAGGTVDVAGTVGSGNAVNVSVKSRRFNPFALPAAASIGVSGAPGPFSASASGIFPALSIRASGSFPSASIGAARLRRVRLAARGKSSANRFMLDRVSVSANGVPVSFSASAKWDSAGNTTVDVSRLDAGALVSMLGLPSAFRPASAIVSGSASFRASSGAWTGTFSSGRGVIAAVPLRSLSGNFSRARGKPLFYSAALDASGKGIRIAGNWRNGSVLSAAFSVPGGTYGKRTVPAVSGTVRMSGGKLEFSPVTISGVKPPLSLKGDYDPATGGLNLRARLSGQDAAAFHFLVPSRFPPVGGALSGDLALAGVYPVLSVDFSGTVKNARYQSYLIPRATLTALGKFPDGVTLHFHTDDFSLDQFEVIQQFIPIGGTGTLDVSADGLSRGVTVAFDFPRATLNGKEIGILSGLAVYSHGDIVVKKFLAPFTSPPVPVSGTVSLRRRAVDLRARFTGEKIGNLVSLLGKSASGAAGNLYGSAALTGSPPGNVALVFSGKGTNLMFSGIRIGDAAVTARVIPSENGYEAKARVSGISLSKLVASHAPLRGLSGEAALDVAKSGGSPMKIAFHLSGLTMRGKSLPPVSGNGSYRASLFRIADVTVPLSPPLVLSGTVNVSTKAISIKGNMTGQSIASIMRLAGGSSGGLDGKISGQLSVGGSFSSPVIRLDGKIRELGYHGLSLGSGALGVFANKESLHGKLSLDQPIFLSGNRSPLGPAIANIPGIGGMLSQLTRGTAVTGATIEGKPENPSVSLIFAAAHESPERKNR